MQNSSPHKSSLPALMLGAIGVVYGDIGTSVLYSMQTVFHFNHLPVTPANVYGIVSLFFWTLTLLVAVKYVLLILRADNHGEGVITPAISVLSAVEGLEVASEAFKHYIIPITLSILLVLFVMQKKGTAGIGKLFGPVMLLWFITIGSLGVMQIVQQPGIVAALSPLHALRFIAEQLRTTFFILGAVVLCVTGGEALYADMGHFGRKPIQWAWFLIVMPPLAMNYLGQGALLLSNPEAAENPFFMMAPKWALYPLVGLATAATVIASQALISGAYSATKQIIQLGYLPRLRILHTSEHETGQIYMPFVNWALFVAIVLVVMMFRSSANLSGAYGIAVTTNMVITTLMTYFVLRYVWKWSLPLVVIPIAFFLVIDGAFWLSNMMKFMHGGWFPLAVAGLIFLLMMTWYRGRALLAARLVSESLQLKEFLASVFADPPQRVAGMAVFMHANQVSVPHALLHNLKHNKVLHEQNLFVTVKNHEVPWIAEEQRLEVNPLGNACWQVLVHYGFMDQIDLPKALLELHKHGCVFEPMQASYFLSRDNIVPSNLPGMARWREKLFAHMHHNASAAAEYLNLPNNAVVELGAKVEI